MSNAESNQERTRRGVSTERRSKVHAKPEPRIRVQQVPQSMPSKRARSRSRSRSASPRRMKKKSGKKDLFPRVPLPEMSEESDDEDLLSGYYDNDELPFDLSKE